MINNKRQQSRFVPQIMSPSLFSFVLGAASAGVAAYLLGPITVDPGDWLAFCGGLIGVSLTVLGVVLVEDRKLNQAYQAEVNLLVGALEQLRDALLTADAEELVTLDTVPQHTEAANAILERISEATAVLGIVRDVSRLRSVGQVLAMLRIEEGLQEAKGVIDREERWVTGAATMYVLNNFYRNVRTVALGLLPKIDAGLAALR